MMNVAIISAWHVHTEQYCKFMAEQPEVKLTAIFDEDPERGKKFAEQFGMDYEPDLDKLLARSDVDSVLCCSATTDHYDYLMRSIKAGKNIFTEKALAPTVKECEELTKAIEEKGIKFVISHPFLSGGAISYAKQVIDDGLLGQVTYFRQRMAHDGSSGGWLPDYWYDMDKTAGGAMMDLGCTPCYVAAYLLGKPKRVLSMFNRICAPAGEDNAVAVVEFENKVIGVIETGFVTPFSSSPIEIQGTEGSLTIDGRKVYLRSKKLGVDGTVNVEKLPESRPAPLRQWIDVVEHGAENFLDMKKAIALTELLEAMYKSDKEGKTVVVD